MIKSVLGMMVCGSLLACGSATRAPVASSGALQACEGGVARSDAELGTFRRCALIEGDLAVSGVTSLAPLSQLAAVSGTLRLSSTRLTGLADLRGLESVGSLEIRDNSQLSDLGGLSHLGKARELVIQGNSELRTLDGLSGLRELERLSIRGTSLYSLRGVESLSKVNEIDLVGNLELIDPRALNQVQVAHSVVIQQNPRLCARFGLLAGLAHAEQVSFSQNLALDHSAVQRLVDSRSQTAVASR